MCKSSQRLHCLQFIRILFEIDCFSGWYIAVNKLFRVVTKQDHLYFHPIFPLPILFQMQAKVEFICKRINTNGLVWLQHEKVYLQQCIIMKSNKFPIIFDPNKTKFIQQKSDGYVKKFSRGKSPLRTTLLLTSSISCRFYVHFLT